MDFNIYCSKILIWLSYFSGFCDSLMTLNGKIFIMGFHLCKIFNFLTSWLSIFIALKCWLWLIQFLTLWFNDGSYYSRFWQQSSGVSWFARKWQQYPSWNFRLSQNSSGKFASVFLLPPPPPKWNLLVICCIQNPNPFYFSIFAGSGSKSCYYGLLYAWDDWLWFAQEN